MKPLSLIFCWEPKESFGTIKYHDVTDAILARPDAEPLLRVLMRHITIRGELGGRNFYDGYFRNKDCAALLTTVKAEFEAKYLKKQSIV